MLIFSKILVFFIRIYQKTFGLAKGHTCRFIPTCSEYMVLAIEKHGPLKGAYLGIKRILKCHPWSQQKVDFP